MSLREVVLPATRAVQALPGQELPTLGWVPLAALRIDDSYQRPLERDNWTVIQRIADVFDWTRFSPLLVAPLPGGLYAIIDGQHRAHAARLRGITQVPALIARIDAAGQAGAFAAVNGAITRVTSFHLYRAALAAGTPWAIAARDAVAAAGCTLRTANASTEAKKPREVYAVQLIRHHVAAGRADVVTRALCALAEDGKAGTTAGCWADSVLRPWLDCVAAFPEVPAGSLLRFAGLADPLRLVDRAGVLAAQPAFQGKSRAEIMRISLATMMRHFLATGEAWPSGARTGDRPTQRERAA